MVFSLFRRSDKSASRKGKDARADDSAQVTGQPEGRARDKDTDEKAAREAARLTAQKIDEIENEMIADALTGIGSTHMPGDTKIGEPDDDIISPDSIDEVLRAPIDSLPGPSDVAPILNQSAKSPERADLEPDDALALATGPASDNYDDVAADSGPAAAPGRRPADYDDELAIDIVDGSLPSQLEEAAILYSNGQYQATAETLTACLEDDTLSQAHRTLSWQMLFDLLQVMGEREQFDSLAIRYARLTESSPPAWNEQMRAPNRRKVDRRTSPSNIIAMRELDVNFAKFVDQLLRAADNKRECSLDFSGVRQMDAEAAEEALRLLTGFIAKQKELSLTGASTFYELVTSHIEVGRPDESQAFWQLAMMLLRVMDDQAGFEDLTIDYCVTFEVSPPPWEPVPALFKISDEIESVNVSDKNDEEEAPPAIQIVNNKVLLGEELTGRIVAEKEAMNLLAESNTTVRVDCRELRRMDFSAAGELLNELAAMMGRSRRVQFVEPNFLVYALMLVMGIHEMAEIRRRKI